MNNSAGAIEVVVHYPLTPNGWKELIQRAAQVSFCHTGDTMEKFVWNVIYHDSNGQKITTFNVFDHCGFNDDVKKFLRQCKDKTSFAEEVKRSLKYYFWSKCEWEIIIGPWSGGRNTEEIKVDVCWQVLNNWDHFIDYLWSKKRSRAQ